jgi:hypothetical protein
MGIGLSRHLGPDMVGPWLYLYPQSGYRSLTDMGPGKAKNTWGLPMQITTNLICSVYKVETGDNFCINLA